MTTACNICNKVILEHEPKHVMPNTHTDIPVSQFLICAACAIKQEEKK